MARKTSLVSKFLTWSAKMAGNPITFIAALSSVHLDNIRFFCWV